MKFISESKKTERPVMRCGAWSFGAVAMLVVLAAVLGGGCASTKIAMTPPVKMVVVPEQNRAFYNVEKVNLVFSTPAYTPGWENEGFANRFNALAESRYPGLFRKTPDAIPIAVRIDVNQDVHQGASLGVYLCTLCIVGGIFPSVPWETEWQVAVHAEDARGAPILATHVQAVDRGWWTILTPFGLITISGESDAPKVSTVGTAGPGQISEEHRTYVLQCMVDMLAADLLKQDPSKLPARAPMPALMPSPARPVTTTAPLPPPTETVAPF